MIPDYDFYKNIYKGDKLSEENFDKYISKGLSVISQYTFDRVNQNNINFFPKQLSDNIKMCACELSEFKLNIDNINDELLNPSKLSSAGLLKSITAGKVSKTYDTSSLIKGYTDSKSINKRYKSILNDYLYPQYINGIYYNLLSWCEGNYVRCNDYITKL